MARKPTKTAPIAGFATWIEEDSPGLAGAPTPARRGRKPKSDASPAERFATMDSDDAKTAVPDVKGRSEGSVMTPVRKRPGPKPKQKADATVAASLEKKVTTKPGRKAGAVAAPEPALSEDMSATGLTGGHHEGFVEEAASPKATLDMAINASAQPAAQWDRAADTASFDWPAIKRTAAHEGPNQGIAKLLVAARAEGANSRWPL